MRGGIPACLPSEEEKISFLERALKAFEYFDLIMA
jgi:hypothetical protein